MTVNSLMKVLADGCACFSIKPYCEEYGQGLEELKKEKWYPEIKNREVKRIVTIGGGMYKVETIIELEREKDGQ